MPLGEQRFQICGAIFDAHERMCCLGIELMGQSGCLIEYHELVVPVQPMQGCWAIQAQLHAMTTDRPDG